MNKQNLTIHTDLYQLNMMYGYWKKGIHHKLSVFDLFFRKLPFNNGFAVFAGLERVVDYINNLKFGNDDIEFLRETQNYDEEFLNELRNFRFTGNLYSVREGEIVFPNEPLIRLESRVFELQLLETALLNFVNYQTLIATKAARIKHVAPNDLLMEFGTRRAHEADAAIWGTRAAYISGFNGTSNVRAGKLFGIPVVGTMAHSWVQMFDTELEAFRSYAESRPDNVVLLVDTYDTLKSGVPNAITVAREMAAKGQKMKGIRLDSGDLAYLSIEARKMFDAAGLDYIKIIASNDLDENLIAELKAQGAKIDGWGVGTQLIVAADDPALGGVCKIVAKEKNGEYIPTIKISGNPEKVTTPGLKDVYRIIDKATGKVEGDYIAMAGEEVKNRERLKLFDPVYTWIHKFVTGFEAKELLQPIFINGRQVSELPTLAETREYHKAQLSLFWPEYLRKRNPEVYPVDLSEKVWNTKMELIRQNSK